MLNRKFFVASFNYHFRCYFKYRTNVIFSFFSELAIPLTINILFIIGLTNSSANTRQIIDVISYIIIANITYTISVTNLESSISSDIRNSNLIYKLLEPVPPCANYIVSDFSVKVVRILIFYLPGVFLLGILGQIHYTKFLYAVPFIVIANITGYCLSFIIGCLAFWLTEIWGISAVKDLLLAVFAGTIFPLSFLSEKVQELLLMTPFPYLSYIPSAVILGEIEIHDMLSLLCVGVIWCIVLANLAMVIWTRGKKKYESVGV